MKIYIYKQWLFCLQNNKELPIIVKDKPSYKKSKLLSWFTDYVLFQVKETEEFFPEYYIKNF